MCNSISANQQLSRRYYSPDELLPSFPPSIKKEWLYAHWEELGGVTIGNRKLIKLEVLDANLEGTKREVLHQVERTDKRKSEVSETDRCRNGATELGNEERGTGSRERAKEVGREEIFEDFEEDDPFNLAAFVKNVA